MLMIAELDTAVPQNSVLIVFISTMLTMLDSATTALSQEENPMFLIVVVSKAPVVPSLFNHRPYSTL